MLLFLIPAWLALWFKPGWVSALVLGIALAAAAIGLGMAAERDNLAFGVAVTLAVYVPIAALIVWGRTRGKSK